MDADKQLRCFVFFASWCRSEAVFHRSNAIPDCNQADRTRRIRVTAWCDSGFNFCFVFWKRLHTCPHYRPRTSRPVCSASTRWTLINSFFFLSTEPITVICLESQSEAPRGFDRSNAIPDRNRADRTRGIWVTPQWSRNSSWPLLCFWNWPWRWRPGGCIDSFYIHYTEKSKPFDKQSFYFNGPVTLWNHFDVKYVQICARSEECFRFFKAKNRWNKTLALRQSEFCTCPAPCERAISKPRVAHHYSDPLIWFSLKSAAQAGSKGPIQTGLRMLLMPESNMVGKKKPFGLYILL